MITTLSRNVWLQISALALIGCPASDAVDQSATPRTSTTRADAPSATTTRAETTAPSASDGSTERDSRVPRIEPRAKAELAGKGPDPAHKGTVLAACGGTSTTFLTPAEWNRGGETWTTAVSPDGRSRFATGSHVGDPINGLSEAAGAIGLSECTWSASESTTIGKQKRPATVYDGVCQRGANWVRTGAVTLAGAESCIAVGGWDDGTDGSTVFNVFRSITWVADIDARTLIAACCASLRQSTSAPPRYADNLMAAATACEAGRNSPRVTAVLSAVRAALGGAPVPAACR